MYEDLILRENPNADAILCKYGSSLVEFQEIISRKQYNLTRDLRFTNKGTSLVKELFPHKAPSKLKVHSWLLSRTDYKRCYKCQEIKSLKEFSLNKSKADGLSGECKPCDYTDTKKYAVAATAKYKAAKLQRIPIWADLKEIARIYAECPQGYHVDHIHPLQGEHISGLHVENNLQYLPAHENMSKGNKFVVPSSNGKAFP